MEERRAASRFSLALPVEIRLARDLMAARSILAKMRDISTHGLYFNTPRKLTVGTKFEFSIGLPDEITGATPGYVSGKARAVRVDEGDESRPRRFGIGALIESYQISRAEFGLLT